MAVSFARDPADMYLFFFNDTATTEIYTLSLHDALPISGPMAKSVSDVAIMLGVLESASPEPNDPARSEEHTSELQSPCNLVCRLLLEKKTNASACCWIWRDPRSASSGFATAACSLPHAP